MGGQLAADVRVDEVRSEPVLGGRYRVVEPIGSGGYGDVFAAEHLRLGTRHAIKRLRRTSTEARANLEREGRLQATLRHPNIVRVTDVVEFGDDLGLVMDLVEGPTLDALILQGPVPVPDIESIAQGILSGVQAAHAAGVVHRDLKPANILLEGRPGAWVPKVTDFGIARWAAQPDAAGGRVVGTPSFMAPEQWRDARLVDERADVFAVGVVLFELVTGARAFEGDDADDIRTRIEQEDYTDPSWLVQDLPARWRDAILGALRANVQRRTPSAASLHRHWLTGDGEAPSTTIELPTSTPQGDYESLQRFDAFVGRVDALEQLNAAMALPGLVSVVGPGGVGKTRLVMAAAASASRPVVVVDLAPVRDREQLFRAVGRALGVQLAPSLDALEAQLGDALAGQDDLVVVLDNFEQLLAHASVLRAWRGLAPTATLVVTTRRATDIDGERQVRLAPLDADAAVELLETRARERGRALADPVGLSALAAAVDHLPLALELAVARLGVLTPGQLVNQLQQRPLALRSRDGAGRQGTLRAVLDWSWSLLDGPEKTALAQLSVFAGGADLAAIEAVLTEPADGREVIDVVAELLDRSLLVRGGDLDTPRFGMLHTVRAYAAERLDALAPEARVEREVAHGRWYATRMGGGGDGDPVVSVLAHLDSAGMGDLEEVLIACQRAVARGDVDAAARLLTPAALMIERVGPSETGRHLTRSVLELDLPLRERARARMLHARATVFYDLVRATADFDRAAAESIEAGDGAAASRALNGAGTARCFAGHFDEASERYHQGLELTAEPAHVAMHEYGLGMVARGRGRPHEAYVLLSRAREAFEHQGLRQATLNADHVRAMVCIQLGRLDEATQLLQQAREGFSRLGIGEGVLRSEGQLGAVAHLEGRRQEAAEIYGRVAEAWKRRGENRGHASYLRNLADVQRDLGEPEQALETLLQALPVAERLGDPSLTGEVRRTAARCLLVLGRPDEALAGLGPEITETSIDALYDAAVRARVLAHCEHVDDALVMKARAEEVAASLDLAALPEVAALLDELRAELASLS